MKWSEIKNAVERAGIREDEEITEIRCEFHDGDKTLRLVRLGRFLKLEENLSEEAQRRESAGCAA
ncbi:MAG TPA: hypothetical protein VFD58_31785 [Blastocatellia bacterium]|nr:hypothetical protein [Blastocatellia bacterium]